MRVLIVSASMGAGHDGAARELARRLQADGHDAQVRDFLDAAPLRLGRLLRRGYEFELRHVPSAYDATYRIWYRLPWLAPILTWLVCLLTRRRLTRWVRKSGAEVAVSTYPLATLCLGRLRSIGRLKIPALNFITDFGVHPLWVHKGIDLNLAVHRGPADMARRHSGRPTFACGPMVAEGYDPAQAASPQARQAARDALGLSVDDRAVLVVAGSWGVGSVEDTFDAITHSGRYIPVVVCGRDETLRVRLARRAVRDGRRALVIGWTDRMPELMAGCDALVENAGGLTSLEAMRIGLPVVSFDPIAGHGRENTSAMAKAGISRLAGDVNQLIDVLDLVTGNGPARIKQVAAGQAMFVSDGAKLVAGAGQPAALATFSGPSRVRVAWASASRTAVGVLALAAIGWGGITVGVNNLADVGAGVARPAKSTKTAYVAVRLDAAEVDDPAVRADIRRLGVTVIVDRDTALVTGVELRRMANSGINIENGGHGGWYNASGKRVRPALWTRAAADAAAGPTLAAIIHRRVALLMPGRRINGFDLIETGRDHETIVVANADIVVGAPLPLSYVPTPKAGQIVMVNGLYTTPAQVITVLNRLIGSIHHAGLSVAPLTALA